MLCVTIERHLSVSRLSKVHCPGPYVELTELPVGLHVLLNDGHLWAQVEPDPLQRSQGRTHGVRLVSYQGGRGHG